MTCCLWFPEPVSAFKTQSFFPLQQIVIIIEIFFSLKPMIFTLHSDVCPQLLVFLAGLHIFILAHICSESPTVFEDTPPSFANVQCPQGVKFWVQSRTVQLYLLNLQLALEIKFRMQGNWHSVYSDSGGLTPGVPESSFVLPTETFPLCQGATEGRQQNYKCVTWGYRLYFL